MIFTLKNTYIFASIFELNHFRTSHINRNKYARLSSHRNIFPLKSKMSSGNIYDLICVFRETNWLLLSQCDILSTWLDEMEKRVKLNEMGGKKQLWLAIFDDILCKVACINVSTLRFKHVTRRKSEPLKCGRNVSVCVSAARRHNNKQL